MNEKNYKLEQLTKKLAWLKKFNKNKGRGHAYSHKKNFICLDCKMVYNVHLSCPIHHTDLIMYIGEVPKKRSRKWKNIV